MAKKERNKKINEDEPNILHGIAGSLEEALSEDASELDEDDVIIVDVPKKQHKRQGKQTFFFIAGLVVIVFAVIGIIDITVAAGRAINDIVDKTALKNEFTLFIYPVAATDPPTFDDAEILNDSTIIKAAVSRILLTGDLSKYATDTGLLRIPEFDVETNAKNIFGSGITFEHQTVGHVEDLATYFPDEKVYTVAGSTRVPKYAPTVTSITNVGETFTVTVDYYPPSVSIPGLVIEQTPSKTMIYTITKSGDKKNITSISLSDVSNLT